MKTVRFVTKSEATLRHPYIEDVLIFDTETDSLDTNIAKVKFFGAYSYKYKKYFIFHENEKIGIQKLIDEHKVLVGFNNKSYDNEVITNIKNKIDITYKIVFDCMTVLYDFKRRRPNRETMIIIKDKNGDKISMESALPNHKLKTVCETLGFPITKGDIDYKIFRQDSWTEQELDEIYLYLFKDVNLTRMLFEFYVEYFEPYKEYVNNDNIRKFDYIRSSGGSYAYSAICNLAGLDPDFEDDLFKLQQKALNAGGFVLDPQVDYAEGTIIYADWAGLYPTIMFQCNLFNPRTENDFISDDWGGHILKHDNWWNGGKMFPELQTSYKSDKMGKIENVLHDIFFTRQKYKKLKDSRAQILKLLQNTIYGISGSPIFKNLFNMTTSGDCTYIARTLNQYTAKRFNENGYKVIYGDTDSNFLVLPKEKTIEDYQKLAIEITEEIKSNFPFPSDGFKLDIDDIFKKLWLFHKKMYVGINNDNKLIIKGIPIIKHSSSQLGQLILKRIKPIIIEQQTIKFSRSYFKKIIDEEIKKDITIIGQVYNVRSSDSYKSASSIQCQIATHLGEGSHILIPNKSLGTIGRSKKYCTPEQAKTLSFSDLFLDKVYKELEPFIE